MIKANIRILFLCASVLFVAGCAELRDPVTGIVVGRMWGNYEYHRVYPVLVTTADNQEIVSPEVGLPIATREIYLTPQECLLATGEIYLKREISTKEVLLGLGQLVASLGTALGIVLPFLL